MVAQLESQRTYSPEEYLELEATASERHEYIDGEIIPMPGGTLNHNYLSGNCYLILCLALRGQPYRVFICDQRVQIPAQNTFTYPDVTIVSGQPELLAGRRDTITNPTLIVEVLSPSTRDRDRSEKFLAYRTLPSFREYLLIDQEAICVEQYVKQDANHWLLTIHDDPTAAIALASVPAQIPLADLYDRVEFNAEENETSES